MTTDTHAIKVELGYPEPRFLKHVPLPPLPQSARAKEDREEGEYEIRLRREELCYA